MKRRATGSLTGWRGPRRAAAAVLFVALLVSLEACYYVQAARGHLDVMNRRRPIDEVIIDPDAPAALRERLAMVRDARQFAVDELLLPDNDSYRSYSDLDRDYVVWNVFAAPEFSTDLKTWCYPVAGCVAYRGYFDEEDARRRADKLEAQEYDVFVGGVPAYSTLGRFADPLLNTMMHWTDEDLVATLFHELAHQKLYVKGDSRFNESFATMVAETGLRRWQELRRDASAATGEKRSERSRAVMKVLVSGKEELQRLYASGLAEYEMRARKAEILEALAERARRAGAGERWLEEPLNNARLGSIGLYGERVDAFRAVLDSCDGELACFYDRAEELAALEQDERDAALDDYAETGAAT